MVSGSIVTFLLNAELIFLPYESVLVINAMQESVYSLFDAIVIYSVPVVIKDDEAPWLESNPAKGSIRDNASKAVFPINVDEVKDFSFAIQKLLAGSLIVKEPLVCPVLLCIGQKPALDSAPVRVGIGQERLYTGKHRVRVSEDILTEPDC
jgi:hypothetical protein